MFPVAVGSIQIFEDQADCFFSHFFFERGVVGVVGISFDGVAKRVQTGFGGRLRRQADSQLRVQYRERRDQARIIDRRLVMRLGLGDDRCDRCFRAGAGSCRHREDRRRLFNDLEQPLQLRDVLMRASDASCHRLAGVHRRTAAKGQQAVAAVLAIKLDAAFNIFVRWVCRDAGMEHIVHAFRVECLKQRI